ncbi:MAG: antibiotic biosynthesis monooxygenase [Chloroflexi bacterium]|nr:antibiotic biosynthesis monooxygenase [Chloroflexota bacterium]
MFVTVFTFRAKAGEENSVLALHEEWRRDRLAKARGFVSGELLRGVKDQREFVDIARFESEEASEATANDPEQDAWYRRLVGLTEAEPVVTDCRVALQMGQAIRAL